MGRFFAIALTILVALGATLGGKWYFYVTNTESPYDEVGIELNSRMPDALNAWGCRQLQASFPNAVPPYGCGAADGSVGWRS